MQRALGRRARGDTDHRTVAHQGGIECNRDVTRRRKLAQMRLDRGVICGERGSQRTDRQPAFQVCHIGQFRDKSAVDKNEAARLDIAERRARALGARLGGSVGRHGKRLGVAHQRAQIGIFPILDTPVRQTFFGEQVEGRRALGGDRIVAGQAAAHLREFMRQCGFGRGLDDGDFGVHAKTSS